MRLITWNINSVRLRLPLLKKLVEAEQPDVVCLQETKASDAHFPYDALVDLGFPYVSFRGEKGYNGVAILSQMPFDEERKENFGGKEDARHLAVTLQGGLELHNFYVPAGGDIPDPEVNVKFAHKLRYLDDMQRWCREQKSKDRPMILTGDLNVAPLEHDVWSHKQLLKVVSHTPPETERMAALQKTLDWVDAGRVFVPENEKLYSWWSYRARDWEKSDRGRRLDHIWLTPPLKSALQSTSVLKEVRGWEQPSDHAPVVMDLAI